MPTPTSTRFDETIYAESRWVSEPLRLFDCSRENDGAMALILTSAERARRSRRAPGVRVVGASRCRCRVGRPLRRASSRTGRAGSKRSPGGCGPSPGTGPRDVDVAQVYENFTGPGGRGDHRPRLLHAGGPPATSCTFENLIAPSGRLPLNTAGGNLAEGFIHGMSGAAEAARQILGGSPNPVPDANLSLLTGGPGAPLVSSCLFGSEQTL